MKAVIDAFKRTLWDLRDATQISGITCKAQVHEIGRLSGVFRGRRAGVPKWVGPLMVLPALLLPAVAPAQQSSSKTQTSSNELMALNGNSSKDVQNRVTHDPSYVIGPTTLLDISVWKEPEVSRTVSVRRDGMISLPLLNNVQPKGLKLTDQQAHFPKGWKELITGPKCTGFARRIKHHAIA